mgnify:CR=1 FL=1
MLRIVRVYQHPNGERRVCIIRRADASFPFRIEKLSHVHDESLRNHPGYDDQFWLPVEPVGGIFAMQEDAEAEARACEDWLIGPTA